MTPREGRVPSLFLSAAAPPGARGRRSGAFKLQLDAHSALYHGALAELGNPALILTMGGTLGLGEATSLDIGVGEDLAVNASPDVSFHLRHRF